MARTAVVTADGDDSFECPTCGDALPRRGTDAEPVVCARCGTRNPLEIVGPSHSLPRKRVKRPRTR